MGAGPTRFGWPHPVRTPSRAPACYMARCTCAPPRSTGAKQPVFPTAEPRFGLTLANTDNAMSNSTKPHPSTDDHDAGDNRETLGLLPIRRGVLLPGTTMSVPVGRRRSVALVSNAEGRRSASPSPPSAIPTSKIRSSPICIGSAPSPRSRRCSAPRTASSWRVVLEGLHRFELGSLVQSDPHWSATLRERPDPEPTEADTDRRRGDSRAPSYLHPAQPRTDGAARRQSARPGQLADQDRERPRGGSQRRDRGPAHLRRAASVCVWWRASSPRPRHAGSSSRRSAARSGPSSRRTSASTCSGSSSARSKRSSARATPPRTRSRSCATSSTPWSSPRRFRRSSTGSWPRCPRSIRPSPTPT